MDPLARRVARRYAAEQVWLPDLLGAKTSVVKKAWTVIKRQAKDTNPLLKPNPKAGAGGVVYFTLNAAGGRPLGKKLWNLLDASAGLSATPKWESVADSAYSQLRSGNRALDKVRAAGFAVALLTLSRQRRKAEMANNILNKELQAEIAEAAAEDIGDPAAKETPQTVFQSFLTPEIESLAKSVARQIGPDVAKAGDFILDVLEDGNDRGGSSAAARTVPSTGQTTDFGGLVSDTASQLGWGGQSMEAFAVALMGAVGKAALGTKLQRAFIKEQPELYDPSEL